MIHKIQITSIDRTTLEQNSSVTVGAERTVFVAEFENLNISKIVRALYAETRSKRAKAAK